MQISEGFLGARTSTSYQAARQVHRTDMPDDAQPLQTQQFAASAATTPALAVVSKRSFIYGRTNCKGTLPHASVTDG